MIPVRSILAATSRTPGCDPVVRAAARLARAFRASLTLATIADPWKEDDEAAFRASLVEQWNRSLPHLSIDSDSPGRALRGRDEGPDAVDLAVVFDARPFHGILVHAAAVGADLIVLGPHRGSDLSARWGGTTAERVVRSSDVPCLVVNEEVDLPIRRAGVATDFTPSARGGALLAADWLPKLFAQTAGEGEAAPTLSLVHVASADAPRSEALLTAEQERIRQTVGDGEESIIVDAVHRPGSDVAREVAAWADDHGADLLVVPTEARRGLSRMWSGSQATALTLQAPCSVLLVPPALWRRSPIPLRRIATALDTDRDGPDAWVDHRMTHARRPLERVRLDPEDDVVQQCRERDADLLIVHEDRPEPRGPIPPDLQHLLERTPIPVLVLRDLPDGPIRRILVAVDTGDIWYEKFGWARLLAERFDAQVTIFHAIDLSLSSQVRREPGGEFVPAPAVWMRDNVETTVVPAMRTWLWERARLAGLPSDRVDVVVGLQSPTYAIPMLAHQSEADLVIVAAHAEGRLGRIPLSPIARATLEGGTYPALVVVDRAKREAEWREAARLSDGQETPSTSR